MCGTHFCVETLKLVERIVSTNVPEQLFVYDGPNTISRRADKPYYSSQLLDCQSIWDGLNHIAHPTSHTFETIKIPEKPIQTNEKP